jgi:hypothetical protein
MCSIGALFSGWVAVSGLILLISVYGVSPDYSSVRHTIQAVKFPENAQMLDDITEQLAREGKALSKIAPAAGSAEKK